MRWQRLWDDHDGSALAELYHECATLQLPGAPNIPFGGIFHGRDEIRRANEIAWASCFAVRTEPDDSSLLAIDNTVILQDMKDVYLPNGELVRLSSLQVFTFEGQLIVEHRVEYDTLKFAQFLHFLPLAAHGKQSKNSP
jgi:hypothetical protein